ncbi:hypothetical protein R5R35_006587 [Gryllus longicercus]|uniref:Hcy-binding domain-containing protein n=2 Tax=Gryllus longicercus TaxID=2509291 RepID=A0AAN9VSY6_9ORTH
MAVSMFPPRAEIIVLDGGFATQLTTHVGDIVDGNPLWSAAFLDSTPEAIIQSHLDFLRAGADAIITNTYQASISGFMKHLDLSEEESKHLIKKAVYLAKKAYDKFVEENGSLQGTTQPLIVGSVGPYGACLHDYSEYTGEYVETVSQEELMEWHRPRIQALVEAGVDLLALETIPAQAEGEALLRLLKDFPEQKAWLTFSCKDDAHTSHGENFQECVQSCWQLNPSQLVAIGANCLNPQLVTPLFKGINNEDRTIPLIAYPNSGEKFIPEKGWTKKGECPHISTYVKEWLSLGVIYVGGCCRTYADDISKIKSEVKSWLNEKHLKH